MITYDYNWPGQTIEPEEKKDLMAIANVALSDLTLDECPCLLMFPDSFAHYDRDFGKKKICRLDGDKLFTNSIVGFVGRNSTRLSIHSRFAERKGEDYFLHYMLQKVAKINLFNLQHTISGDSVFDFLVYLFPLYLKKAINQGVYKKYVTKKYNDANARGVVDVSRHIRSNEPFNGRVAYRTREFSYDNEVTQLIRHTIAFIEKYKGGDLLRIDFDTIQAVEQMISATPSYSPNQRQAVINQNLRPPEHPYYSEYTPLQKLCLQILRHEELKYGQCEDEIYGVLIDAAWLWEEYLALLLEEKYTHYFLGDGNPIRLFKQGQRIIPDYVAVDKSSVADAKYIPLKEQRTYGEEKATAIYYKTIAYMYRFCTNKGYLFFPHPDEEVKPEVLDLLSEVDGVNGGTITKLGLRIPSGSDSFSNFIARMEQNERSFLSHL